MSLTLDSAHWANRIQGHTSFFHCHRKINCNPPPRFLQLSQITDTHEHMHTFLLLQRLTLTVTVDRYNPRGDAVTFTCSSPLFFSSPPSPSLLPLTNVNSRQSLFTHSDGVKEDVCAAHYSGAISDVLLIFSIKQIHLCFIRA